MILGRPFSWMYSINTNFGFWFWWPNTLSLTGCHPPNSLSSLRPATLDREREKGRACVLFTHPPTQDAERERERDRERVCTYIKMRWSLSLSLSDASLHEAPPCLCVSSSFICIIQFKKKKKKTPSRLLPPSFILYCIYLSFSFSFCLLLLLLLAHWKNKRR